MHSQHSNRELFLIPLCPRSIPLLLGCPRGPPARSLLLSVCVVAPSCGIWGIFRSLSLVFRQFLCARGPGFHTHWMFLYWQRDRQRALLASDILVSDDQGVSALELTVNNSSVSAHQLFIYFQKSLVVIFPASKGRGCNCQCGLAASSAWLCPVSSLAVLGSHSPGEGESEASPGIERCRYWSSCRLGSCLHKADGAFPVVGAVVGCKFSVGWQRHHSDKETACL